MAPHTDMDTEDRATGPTYKSLFIAACTIIGGAFGWWFTGVMAEFNALAARVAVLEIRDAENRWTFKINSEKIERLERSANSPK